jgi:hypothetical protein
MGCKADLKFQEEALEAMCDEDLLGEDYLDQLRAAWVAAKVAKFVDGRKPWARFWTP